MYQSELCSGNMVPIWIGEDWGREKASALTTSQMKGPVEKCSHMPGVWRSDGTWQERRREG